MAVENESETGTPVEIKAKMKFTGKVIRVSLAGALIDIGTGHKAVLHISQMSPEEEPLHRVDLQVGQDVDVWVKRVREDHVELTMVKPLDLDWRDLKAEMVVKGKVVRLEKFGVFVDIGAERPGLVHISEMSHGYVKTPGDMVKEGDEIEAMVLEVNRKKKQIKLSMKAVMPEPEETEESAPRQRSGGDEAPRERVERGPRPERSDRGDRPARRKGGRKGKEDNVVDLSFMDEGESSEPDPTAMEIAIREAMERSKQKKSAEKARRVERAKSFEQDDLLARTLETKVRTS